MYPLCVETANRLYAIANALRDCDIINYNDGILSATNSNSGRKCVCHIYTANELILYVSSQNLSVHTTVALLSIFVQVNCETITTAYLSVAESSLSFNQGHDLEPSKVNLQVFVCVARHLFLWTPSAAVCFRPYSAAASFIICQIKKRVTT